MGRNVGVLFGVLALAGCSEERPPPEPVFTDARALVQGVPKAIGEECTLSGSDGCTTGTCLKVEPGMPGRHICTTGCAPNGSRPCPAAWACVQVRAGEDGFFCVPPANWQAQVATLEPAGLRSAPSLPVRPLPASRDGGR